MAASEDPIIAVLEEWARPLTSKSIARHLGYHPGQRKAVERRLEELAEQGVLARDGRHYVLTRALRAGGGNPRKSARRGEPAAPFAPAGSSRGGRGKGEVAGILKIRPDGVGRLMVEGGDPLFVSPEEAEQALPGDRVLARVHTSRPGRSEARLLSVLDRTRTELVGTYFARGRRAFVVPSEPGLVELVFVPPTDKVTDGSSVRVRLEGPPRLLSPGEGLSGEIVAELSADDPSAEVLAVAVAHGFSDVFPAAVLEEAEQILPEVQPFEIREAGRRDVRDLPLITIDGADARDFDDAVFAEREGRGWRLVVAIADVAHYVTEGSALDEEALRRATSVYLPDRVLPMLPERLSNGICSLNPDVDRLCRVAEMRFDAKGKRLETELYPGVMRSAARCTYEDVQAAIDGSPPSDKRHLMPRFEALTELSRTLRKMRSERGALDFDIPEVKVRIDSDGAPVEMQRRDRVESHRVVEECMLAANEAVAAFFREHDVPSVFRHHAEPDSEKLASFTALAEASGFHLGAIDDQSSRKLAELLEQLEGHPQKRTLNQLLLRSMMQALYTTEASSHYGLAAEHYLHFTSPIRRYPDLLVHRLLYAFEARGGVRRQGRGRGRGAKEGAGLGVPQRELDRLAELAARSSERERAAMQVEREVTSYYAARLMEGREGERFEGAVAAVTDFGFFVELDDPIVEGLVKMESVELGGRLDPRWHVIIYPSGKVIRIGTRVAVRLEAADVRRRRIDLSILEIFEEKRSEKGRPAKAGPGRKGARGRSTEQTEAAPSRRRSPRRDEVAPSRQDETAPSRGSAERDEAAPSRRPAERDEAPRSRRAAREEEAPVGQVEMFSPPAQAEAERPAAAERPARRRSSVPSREEILSGRALSKRRGGRAPEVVQESPARKAAMAAKRAAAGVAEPAPASEDPGSRRGSRSGGARSASKSGGAKKATSKRGKVETGRTKGSPRKRPSTKKGPPKGR